jgi:hypothetical protein
MDGIHAKCISGNGPLDDARAVCQLRDQVLHVKVPHTAVENRAPNTSYISQAEKRKVA